MSKPKPTARTLDKAFPGHGTAMRTLLTSKEAVDVHPAVLAWERQCYNRPSLAERRMCALNAEAGTYGVEAVWHRSSDRVPAFVYLNVGDPYMPTLVRFASGAYQVRCWGDIVEHGTYA